MRFTPGPWRIPGANVFRVVSESAPHNNARSGECPPYPWAIVAETNPDSVDPAQAAANARLIAAGPELLHAASEALNALLDYVPQMEARGAVMGYGKAVIATLQAALAKAEART